MGGPELVHAVYHVWMVLFSSEYSMEDGTVYILVSQSAIDRDFTDPKKML